ncbi:YqcI/YcgG family protein [Streptomyces sp. NPDC050560]|uniref:YqcI/YcgG family protein n=1 Tax=Streptomyces sp. NPDC050560 TaxID=3365630 RepID=UPI0037AD5955
MSSNPPPDPGPASGKAAPQARRAAPTSDLALTACTVGDIPPWGIAAARDLVGTLLDGGRPFPCTFAVAAAKKGGLRFGFVESPHDERTWEPLVGILRSYLDVYQRLGRDTSLVVLFRPEDGERRGPDALDHFFDRFWALLRFLHERDDQPWPGRVPLDPEDPWWEFSFGGTEIFVVCNTPAHVTRHSRHSPGFMVTFQPRWVFEGLEPGTPRGDRSREVIRQRIRRFDGMEPAPQLGNFGDPANREWSQYFLPDTPGGSTPRCPFLARAGARGAPGEAVAVPRGHAQDGDEAMAPHEDAPEPAGSGADGYRVLVNGDLQYSLWPAAAGLPGRWRDTGVSGSREACLAHVARVWTDMRPARFRRPEGAGVA